MKNIQRTLLVLMAFSYSFLGYANKEVPELGEIDNILRIEIESESGAINIERRFDTSNALFDFNVADILTSITVEDDFCTVSITVRVRVGVDSNFIEVSATVSDIPCDDVATVARRTIEQLKEGIK